MCVDIADMLNKYTAKVDQVIPIVKEEIDKAAEQVKRDIDNGVRAEHYQTGELASSLTISPLASNDKPNAKKYGYEIEFKGENAHGVPYAKIANILNYGRDAFEGSKTKKAYGGIEGSHFIDEAIRPLKGLTKRISERIEKHLLDSEKK